MLACQVQADGRDISPDIGIVSFNNSKMQMSTTKNLREENVLICSYARKHCDAYSGCDFSSEKTNDAVEDAVDGNKMYTYSYNGANRHGSQLNTSIAFISYGGEIKVDDVKFNGQRSLIINGKRFRDIFEYCTKSEGVNVVSRSGDVHIYYFLGYEVEANCSDEVYK